MAYQYIEETASLRQQGMGNPPGGGRFSAEVQRVRASDYDCPKTGRKKYQRFKEKGLKQAPACGIMSNCDTL